MLESNDFARPCSDGTFPFLYRAGGPVKRSSRESAPVCLGRQERKSWHAGGVRASILLALGVTLVACDPKGNGGSATIATTVTTDDTASSDSTSGATGAGATSTDTTLGAATTGSSSSTAASTGDVAPELCTCDGGDCGSSPTLCDPIEAHCDGPCADTSWAAVDNEAALQCVLAALRDRTPGDVAWSASTISDGPGGESVTLRILADGTALVYPSLETIFCTSTGPDTHSTLKEPGYFEGCLAQPAPEDRFLCMIPATATDLAECAPFQNCKP